MNTEERLNYLYQQCDEYRQERNEWRKLALVGLALSIGLASGWALQIGGLL